MWKMIKRIKLKYGILLCDKKKTNSDKFKDVSYN